jgi:hypothetical protein
MKTITLLLALLLATTLSAQVSVSTDGSSPDPSAMLEVKSTDKGLLIPRLTTVQRTGISNPAIGLLVYDSTTESFWFYNSGGWTELVSTNSPEANSIQDADGDTKIQTEKNADEDVIRFDLGGTEKMVLQGDRLEVLGSNNNLFIGKETGLANLTGYNNTAVGHYSLNSNTTGYANVAIGNKALFLNTDRRDLVAVGDMALYNNGVGASGDQQGLINTAVGSKVLLSNNIGSFNTGMGGYALYYNTTGNGNTGYGTFALHRNNTGSNNTASGYSAMYNNLGGQYNAALGYEALFYNNGAGYNSSFGNQSLYNNRGGSNNTAFGNQAGYLNVDGSHNIFIGNKAGYNETGSNRLYIDVSETSSPLIWGDFSNSLLNINGSLGIGTTNPLNKLHIIASSDPIRLEGLQETIEDTVLVVASDGVVSKRSISGLAGDPSWSLTGNAGTDPATDFIGTTDYKPLKFRVNGQPAGVIHPVSGNTILGYQTFLSNTTGVYNSGYGQWSLYSNTSGSYNSAFGRYSLMNNTEGAFNSAYGDGSLAANQSGSYNTAYGAGSIASNLNGFGNAAVGESTLGLMTNGNYNTAIGKEALLYNITGSKNVAIGYHAGYHETDDNRLYIDNDAHEDLADGREKSLIYGVFDADPANQKLTLNANVGIGTIDPLNRLHIVADADPLRLEGLQTTTNENFLVVDTNGVVSLRTWGEEGTGWGLTGNSGTNPAINFIGTTDGQPLRFRIYNYNAGALHFTNTSLGVFTLNPNTGNYNTAMGGYALQNNIDDMNTGIGYYALHANSEGFENTAVGTFTLAQNTYGNFNVAVGSDALASNSNGAFNTALGNFSMIGNTTGSSNTATGSSALGGNTTGSYNTANGYNALQLSWGGSGNTAVGSNTLTMLNGASYNVALGYGAGYYETGSNKLFIDNQSRADEQDGRNKAMIYGVFDADPANQKLSFNAGVGINTTAPDASAALDVSSTTKGFLPPRMTSDQISAIASPSAGLIVYNSTINKLQYYDGSVWRNADFSHYIGETYGGGKVFYVYDNGHHGLIAATTDQSPTSGLPWSNYVSIYTGTTGDGINSGEMNTSISIAEQLEYNPTVNFAAKACADYSLIVNGVNYGDWYLPSKYELNLLYQQKDVVGGFYYDYYWSSNELDNYSAWFQIFSDGSQTYTPKNQLFHIRAIRAF